MVKRINRINKKMESKANELYHVHDVFNYFTHTDNAYADRAFHANISV